MVLHSQKQRLNSPPIVTDEYPSIIFANASGTTNDPYLLFYQAGTLWEFVGVSNNVEVTTTSHALVTTGIAGTLQAGDLLIACISSRIASTTPVTLPTGGAWTLVGQRNANNTATNNSAASSATMAYAIRGASNPNLTFTHPVAPSVAIGRIVAYRNVEQTSSLDVATSFSTATNTTAVSGAGLTTTLTDDLIVAMVSGGQEAAWTSFEAATDPIGPSGAASAPVTDAPSPAIWSARAQTVTTTGADTSLAIFDVVKLVAGATGNLGVTGTIGAVHSVVAGAFKIAVPVPTGGTLTADKGSVVLAGVATGLRADRRMTAGTAMVAVAGPATGISKGYLLGASVGAVTVTRYDANFIHQHFYALPVTVGAVTVTFNDANLVKVGAKVLLADTGAITFAGYAAGLRGGRGVLASKGSITLAGQAATLRHTHVLTAATGAVALSGQAATLRHASIMPAVVGAVTLTGYAADLRKAGSLGMAANTGAVTVALQSATLRRTIKMPAVTGAVTLSGQAATLRYGQMLTAAKGAVTLAGQAATLRRTTVMPAATGAIAVTGVDATLRLQQVYKLIAAPGGIVVTGQPVALSTALHRTLAAAPGAVALAGQAATLRHGWALPATTAPIVVTGVAVDLTYVARVHYQLSVTPGQIVLDGQPANLLANVREKQPGPLVFGRRLVVIPGRW